MKVRYASLVAAIFLSGATSHGGDWTIDSPSNGSKNYPVEGNVSCEGEANDEGIEWICKIFQQFNNFTRSGTVSGTSTGAGEHEWGAGTITAPTGDWLNASAEVTLSDRDTDEILVQNHTIYFGTSGDEEE